MDGACTNIITVREAVGLAAGPPGTRSAPQRSYQWCAWRTLLSRCAQLPLLLAHVCALTLTLSVLSHSYARLSFRRLARVLIARSTVVERRITYYLGDYLYYDDVEVVNALGQFLELDARA